ncbi:MAG: chemotaxis protein CheA [Firmicutes bacterium]|nr:chemotaxis protein CheA [Bacillota bacterium]
MDFSEYKDVFAAEAREYIQSLNENLLEFEQTPQDEQLITEMFRAAHSLKGMAGTMGYTELADLTHHMENLLDALRNDQIAATGELINTLFGSVDVLEVMLNEVISTDHISTDTTLIKEQLAEILDNQSSGIALGQARADVDSSEQGAVTLPLNEYDRELIKEAFAKDLHALAVTVVLRDNVLMKSVRAYTVFQVLERLGTVVKSVPSAEDIDEERFDDRFTVLLFSHHSKGDIQDALLGVPEVIEVTVGEVTLDGSGSSPVETQNAGSGATGVDVASILAPAGRGRAEGSHRIIERFVRVETERLDELNNLVGELVISRTQVTEIAKHLDGTHARAAVAQLDRVTTELQYAAMKLRMVPVKQVFDRFPRMVRDLAKTAGKEVNLQVVGEDTELDRSLMNQIGDPLVHLIRNAVDHGLEAGDVRRRLGKPAAGRIRLEARHEGSHVVIEVADDGRGIDPKRVKDKALNIGLITREQAAKLTDAEAQALIFEAGFSTTEEVTDVSGRGVGMDAVRAALDSMNGSVDVRSELGKGTTVALRLPLTLAIIRALLVRADSEICAIPIQSVRENLRVAPKAIKTIHGERVITLRNEVLPILDLPQLLGFETSEHQGDLPIIVVEAGSAKAGLIIDELLGQQEVVIKSLSSMLGDIQGVAGATVLGDGTVALILDVSAVLNELSADHR